MSSPVVRTHDVYDFSRLPNPLEVGNQPPTRPDSFDRHYHPVAGLLEYSNVTLPHMHVMNLKRTTERAVRMINDRPVDVVNFNFQLTGFNNIKYHGLNHDLNATAGKHYMIYNPDSGYESEVVADTEMEVLLISLDKQFLMSSIISDDPFSERLMHFLDRARTFSGSEQPLEITPAMWHLIREIKNNSVQGPMRKLFVQSKVLELIALQLDQFRTPVVHSGSIRPGDADKLYQLKTYLDANFLSELSLNQLSRECLLNEFKVKSGFKQLFGSSVFNYLKKVRMEYAANLLRNSSMNIDEVANTLGYEHAQHFSTAFKNFIGVSPSTYRSQSGK